MHRTPEYFTIRLHDGYSIMMDAVHNSNNVKRDHADRQDQHRRNQVDRQQPGLEIQKQHQLYWHSLPQMLKLKNKKELQQMTTVVMMTRIMFTVPRHLVYIQPLL